MQIIADTHFHLYERYDIDRALRSLQQNLLKLAAPSATGQKTQLVACLTERRDCDFFERFFQAPFSMDGLEMRPGDDGLSLILQGEPGLTLFAGSQIVTAERLEVLALVCRERFRDGLPAADTLAAIQAAGGVAVLPWSPGKWLGRRGERVRELLESHAPATLSVGDTAMRPRGTPEPALITLARKRGHACVAGSDPLPVAGEEAVMGRYASHWSTQEAEQPLGAEAMKALLRSPENAAVGQRNDLLKAARRWIGNARAKS